VIEQLLHGDCQTTYRVEGTGATVLLLHGSLGSHLLWRRLSRALKARYRAVAPDLLGYGGSSGWPAAAPFGLADEMAPLWRLMPEDMNLHLVGYSYGAVVALGLALAKRRRLASLTLVEPAAFSVLREAGETELLEQVSAWRRCFEDQARAGNLSAAMREFVDYWFGEGSWGALTDEMRGPLLAAVPKVLLDLAASFNSSFEAAALAELSVPTLVVGGGQSPAPTRSIVRILARLIGNCRLAVIEAAGHDLPVTHSAELTALIIQRVGA
jgi:lipase